MVGDPLFKAILMKNVRVIACQLHYPRLILKPLHADAAVEPLLEDKITERDLPKLLESLWSINTTSIDTTNIA